MKPIARLRQGGFTLVELMISLAIGLVVVLALITMLININRNNSELAVSNRMVENGRFAMQLLGSDLAHAGYWGGHVPAHDNLSFAGTPALATTAGGSIPTALPDPCTAYSVANWTGAYQANLLGVHVQGSNVTTGSVAPFCSGVLTTPRASTDAIVVRHLEPCVAGSGTNECADTVGAANPDVYMQVSQCPDDTATFVISTTAGDFRLRRRTCATLPASPAAPPASAITPRRRIASSIYYVKNDNSVPTLMRSQLLAAGGAPTHQAAQALVENIDGFRVEFGIDSLSDSGEAVTPGAAIAWANVNVKNSPRNRGDGVPDGAFIRCTQAAACTPAQMMNAVAVRLYVLVRAERPTPGHNDARVYRMGSAATACANAAAADSNADCAPTLGPFNDGYRRQLFTQTVRLVNVSSRRETP